MVEALFRPLGRMWRSDAPLDTYGLAHFGSVAGDALVAIALAGSLFFYIPVGESKPKVAGYLALTMAPLAVAGPLLVPLLDRAGPRRVIRSAPRSAARLCASSRHRGSTPCCCSPPRSCSSFCRRCTRSRRTGSRSPTPGRTRASCGRTRLGRIAAGGALLAIGPGLLALQFGDSRSVLYLAAVVYGAAAALNLRLPHARLTGGDAEVTKTGRSRSSPPRRSGPRASRRERLPAVRARVRAASRAASPPGGSPCSRARPRPAGSSAT